MCKLLKMQGFAKKGVLKTDGYNAAACTVSTAYLKG